MSQSHSEIDRLLKLVTGEFSVTGTLKVQAMAPPELITRDSLNGYLRGREVQPHCVSQSELDLLVAAVAQDPDQPHERVVAKGRLPEHGRNASIEFTPAIGERFARIQKRKEAFMLAQVEDSLDSDDGTAIDFYNESSFVTAHEGEHIANLIPHTDGTDGINIFGGKITAKAGKPMIKPTDESCRVDKDGRIIAMHDGLVQRQSDRVIINRKLNIPGFVDFTTGNLDFPGSIVIEKGVRDRFRVDSDVDIEIHQLVEAAHLHADNNIKLHQGMAGREVGTINAEGNLDSGYLDAVEATIMGDCIIEKEVTNCTLRISGRIKAKNATIRGGLIEIAQGGVVGVLGSSGDVRTDVVLASHPILQHKIANIREIQPKIASEIERAEREVAGLKAGMGKSNPELETEIRHLDSNIQAFRSKLDDLEHAMQRMLTLLEKHTRCELTVMGTLYAKTQLWVPGKHATFDRDLNGEFTIRLDKANKPIIDWGAKTEPLDQYAKVHSDERIPARRIPGASKAA